MLLSVLISIFLCRNLSVGTTPTRMVRLLGQPSSTRLVNQFSIRTGSVYLNECMCIVGLWSDLCPARPKCTLWHAYCWCAPSFSVRFIQIIIYQVSTVFIGCVLLIADELKFICVKMTLKVMPKMAWSTLMAFRNIGNHYSKQEGCNVTELFFFLNRLVDFRRGVSL